MAVFTVLAIALAASWLLAQGARAQGSACDQLKATLAARIDPSIRGFSLDTVAASTPVPAGAKVIGTCEGGAYKILFRRSGGTPAPSSAPSAVAQVPAPVASPVTAASTPRPAPTQPRPAIGAREPEIGAVAPASAAGNDIAVTLEPSTAPAVSVQPATPPGDSTPFAQRAAEFLRRYWYAFAALALMALAPTLWSWVAYRRAYDASGLPRGPRIR